MFGAVLVVLSAGTAMAQNAASNSDIYDKCPTHFNSGGSVREAKATGVYNAAIKQGDALLNLRDFSNAEMSYRQATEAMPTFPQGWIRLAQALDYQGYTQEAFAAYEAVFKLSSVVFSSANPRDAEGLARYGVLCEQYGQHEEAIKSYNKARIWGNAVSLKTLDQTLNATTASPLLTKTMLNILRGFCIENDDRQSGSKARSLEALTAFQGAAKDMPDDARVNYSLGYGYQQSGNYLAAQAAFAKAARLDTEGAVKAAASKELPISMQPR